jgi:hypothetical protein
VSCVRKKLSDLGQSGDTAEFFKEPFEHKPNLSLSTQQANSLSEKECTDHLATQYDYELLDSEV